jgi:hypothetical protein
MPVTFIDVNTSTRHGAKLRRFVEVLREAREQSDEIMAIAATQIDGVNHALFEQQFGLQAGVGAGVATMLTNVSTALNVAAVNNLISRVG